jgi:copper chaperone CopZ
MKTQKFFQKAISMIAIVILIGSCAETADQQATVDDVNVTYTNVVAEGSEKHTAILAIEGMACEMMCGNKIASTLSGLEGVRNTEINFEGEGEINSAVVEYDAAVISEKEMITAVNALANGHYKVKSVQVTHHKLAGTAAEKNDKTSQYNTSLEYKLPNIFSVFSQLF